MIIKAILDGLVIVISAVLGLIDMAAVLLPDSVYDTFEQFAQMSLLIDSVFPVSTLYILVFTALAFESSVIIYKLNMWIFEQIRHILKS